MEQSTNLLAAFNVEGSRPDDFWQQRMMALGAGGLDDFRATLKTALESGDATVVQQAERALRTIRQIATMRGVTHEAIVTAFEGLQTQYITTRNTVAQGMKIKRDSPAARVYTKYPELYASCHASAAAILPSFGKEAGKPTATPATTQAPAQPAPKPAGKGEKPAPQPAAAKAPAATKTPRKPATAPDAMADAAIAPTLQPTRTAASAKPAKPAPKPAGKPATKPADTGEIGLAPEPGGFDFSPVDTPDAAVPTGMDDIDFQVSDEPDEDLARVLGLRTEDEKPKKPGRVDPSKPKR